MQLSIYEAEIFAIFELYKYIHWIVNLFSELKCNQLINDSAALISDSQAAYQWIKCTRSSNKSRHINLRIYFLRHLLTENKIKLDYVQTEVLIADFLTKVVNEYKFGYFMKNTLMIFFSE